MKEKIRAIPQGYMTVGEVAKKMGVTVRTLQYYDEQNLLSPSSQSESGRRLYTDKDVIKLYQILSLKHLGFSLDDIKNRLISLDSPTDVAAALSGQADILQEKIESLTKLMKTESVIASDSEWMEKQVLANAFIEPALDTYFTTLGYNPLEEDVR